MKHSVTVYPLALDKMFNNGDEQKIKDLIEKAGMTGDVPRALFVCRFYKTDKQALALIAGNVGNYNDRIIQLVEKEFDCNANFVSGEEAQQIFDNENLYL